MNLDETLRPNIFIKGKFIILKIQILYQEDMNLEEGARREPSSSCAPEKYDFRKNLESVYLERQHICLADNSNLVSGEHDHGRGDTTGTVSSGSPGTDDIRKYIECVCLEKPQIRLADNSNPESLEHDHVRVGTTGPPVKRFC